MLGPRIPLLRIDLSLGRGPARSGLRAPRINRLCAIRPAVRYLEIGASRGTTFLAVDIATKHAVDPQFRFDTAPHETADVRFFPITSDAYFTREATANLVFDIIFLDGLHTFERDLPRLLRLDGARSSGYGGSDSR